MNQPIRLPPYLLRLMALLESAGEEVYLVGGSLRDALLGIPPHDFDLASSALPEKTLAVFREFRVIETGLKHGTVTVLSEGGPVEITTFRIDGAYTDSRHPDGVTFTRRIDEDLSRRDFTVNAMAYHPRAGLVDPFGGREDLEKKLLRAVGDPTLRFSEDALRIMRAFRFSAQLGFLIEDETLRGIAATREGLSAIAVERIASEFLRLLLSEDPAPALSRMEELEILPYVCGGYRPSHERLTLLSKAPAEDVARLGVFFSELTPEEAAERLRQLRLSNRQITGCRAVIRGSAYEVTSPADARRLIADCGVYALSAVRLSVLLGRSPAEAVDWVAENKSPCTLSELAVGGKELIGAGIEPRRVGKTLEWLLSRVLEDPKKNEKEILIEMAAAYDKKRG